MSAGCQVPIHKVLKTLKRWQVCGRPEFELNVCDASQVDAKNTYALGRKQEISQRTGAQRAKHSKTKLGHVIGASSSLGNWKRPCEKIV